MPDPTLYMIDPVAKPRMTRRDKWDKRPCVQKYWDFKRDLGAFRFELPEYHKIIFFVPMPKNWSNSKKAEMAGKPHRQRPDLDNFLKAIGDFFEDDSHIWRWNAEKRWAYRGAIEVTQDEAGRVKG